ncbi:MAG: EFR1 family ferrodoxin [Acholeplasmatales bacterium]|nr:EFR1 family ferrodoxin [Acholeplasmatales bacterium]
MIIYFSSTGNTEFIAKEIANRLDDDSINLLNRIKNNDYSIINSSKPFIILLPVYICTIPTFLIKYLKKLKLNGNKNCYFVFTSGGYAGMSSSKAHSICRKLKLKYRGRAEFKMPRNYLISGHYPPNTDEEIEERIRNSYNKIDDVCNIIKNNQKLKERHIWLFEKIIILPFVPVWRKLKHTTKDFYVNDKCIGCGICVKKCPINCIKIENNKPIWISSHCEHCMGCLQNCPKEAIEYKNKTEGKRRYSINRYKNIIEELKK